MNTWISPTKFEVKDVFKKGRESIAVTAPRPGSSRAPLSCCHGTGLSFGAALTVRGESVRVPLLLYAAQ